MNPLNFAAALCVVIGSVVTLVNSMVVPGASTPVFYLVASTSSDSAANLMPLRTSGGDNGYSTLTGSGSIGQFYFYQGKFVVLDSSESSTIRGYIAEIPLSDCSTYGQLGFSATSSDKCANFNTFNIQSDSENSQLGASLVFNFVGGFYACGSTQDVWYLESPSDGPPGISCSSINLYTVPLV